MNETKEDENDDCESLHGLKDTQCAPQLNTRCESVGKVCKKKCGGGEEYKCKSDNLSKMQCDVENGVCEATHRCKPRDNFRRLDPVSPNLGQSSNKCRKRNVF